MFISIRVVCAVVSISVAGCGARLAGAQKGSTPAKCAPPVLTEAMAGLCCRASHL